MSPLVTLFTSALFALPALAAPAAPPALTPWVISHLSFLQPSGRPGSTTDFTLNITISDPNTIPISRAPAGTSFGPSTATCAAVWHYGTKPWGKVFACQSSDKTASWTVQPLEPLGNPDVTGSMTHNFDLRFEETRKLKVEKHTATKVFAAQGHFEYRLNLDVVCGGSGVCSGALIPGTKVEVQPLRTDCSQGPARKRGDEDC